MHLCSLYLHVSQLRTIGFIYTNVTSNVTTKLLIITMHVNFGATLSVIYNILDPDLAC